MVASNFLKYEHLFTSKNHPNLIVHEINDENAEVFYTEFYIRVINRLRRRNISQYFLFFQPELHYLGVGGCGHLEFLS